MRESSSWGFGLSVSTSIECELGVESLHIAIGLCKDNTLQRILDEIEPDLGSNHSASTLWSISINPDITQGEYTIKLYYRENENEDWTQARGSDEKYLSICITENHLVINQVPENYEESSVVEYGIDTVDGITYRFYGLRDYDNVHYYADIIPYEVNGFYAGDINIPDYLMYQDMKFETKSVDGFILCPDLTSLSTPASCNIINCGSLKKLELREGATGYNEITNCPMLKEISYPSTASNILFPKGCEELTSVKINNSQPISIWGGFWVNDLTSLRDIYFTGEFPPVFDALVEINKENITVHVPTGTLEVFRRSGWADWNLVEDAPSIPVNVKLDYCGNNEPLGLGFFVGYRQPSGPHNIEFAMHIPGTHLKAYKNCKVTAIEYYQLGDIPTDFYTGKPDYSFQVEYVFLTTYGKDYLIKQPVKVVPGWRRIEFTQPYIISGEDIFVGIGRPDILTMGYANLDLVDNDAFLYRIMGPDFGPNSWSGDDLMVYPFPIRAIVQGDNLPTDVVIANVSIVENSVDTSDNALSEAKSYGRSNTAELQALLKIRNKSPKPVKQITLDWDVDGKAQDPINVDTYLLTNHEDIVVVDLPNGLAGHNHKASFSVADIDGEPDGVPENSNPLAFFEISSSMTFPRRYVMEEATGTWCQWCPRGMATIEHMKTLYPDNFIPIAIHYGDMMQPADGTYDGFLSQVSSYPAALVNRQSWIDVNPFELGEERNLAVAMIKAGAEFTEAGEVEVTAETTFGFSESGNGDYRVAYVLLENNVGPDYQTNAYSAPEAPDDPDDLMNWWTHQEQYVEMTFDHVARSIHDYNGVGGQLPSAFAEDEPLTTVYTFPLPENVQNAENLYVVTLLIDGLTGEILNADETGITGTPPAGIVEVRADADAVFDVYSLSGIRVRSGVTTVEGLPAGIYIVNGRKVAVR